MTGLSRIFVMLGLAVGLVAFAESFGAQRASRSWKKPMVKRPAAKKFWNQSLKPTSSFTKQADRICSDDSFSKFELARESSLVVAPVDKYSDFCGLRVTVDDDQLITLRCTEFDLPFDFSLFAKTQYDEIEVFESGEEYTFFDSMMLLFVVGPRDIDLTDSFRCEIFSSEFGIIPEGPVNPPTNPETEPPVNPPTTPKPEPPVNPTTTPKPEPPSTGCKCGVPNADRIVGGSNAPVGKFPWIVGLSSSRDSGIFCGGTLISATQVISAAHCQVRVNQYARIGEYDTNKNEEYTVFKRIIAVRNNPDYDDSTLNNDIAILTLESPVTFSSKISPICLPETDRNYENEIVTAAGWGTLSSGGSQPSILQEVDVPVKTQASCASSYPQYEITQQMICAGVKGKDSCQGDSGGPLMFRSTSQSPFELIGVTSWGIGCAEANKPGVYARVTALKTFIFQHVAQSSLCPRP